MIYPHTSGPGVFVEGGVRATVCWKKKNMRIRRMAAIALTAAALVAATASPSSALTGGNITNSSLSTKYINVYQPSGVGIKIQPGDYTSHYPGYAYNIDKFYIPGVAVDGVVRCAASQWSPPGTCPYKSGTTYKVNGLALKLRVYEYA